MGEVQRDGEGNEKAERSLESEYRLNGTLGGPKGKLKPS